MKLSSAIAFGCALVAGSTAAHAFCGFYVSPSGEKMFADATEVVLMRSGTRTVLAMQNDFKGPLEDFAMVVPVPVVLKEDDVRVLKKDIFERVDAMGSPRLVQYWEQDPCPMEWGTIGIGYGTVGYGSGMGASYGSIGIRSSSVKVEAKFDVAEYNIVILSATEAAGLQKWLEENKYKIPKGAEPLLRPYIEAGSKFFVAKVDPKKVEIGEDGHASLSPLRFHYDSDEFSLPIRLGMANSSGKQDLIVNIISPDKRYEVSNYKNVFIPTNIDVKTTVKARFAEFYTALFDATIAANPRAVVTEYSWTATPGAKCDPCPDNEMRANDVTILGGDVIDGDVENKFVLTRLYARYGAKDMKDDLRFKEAKAVTGGREEWTKKGLEYGATPSEENFFQARYAIRHWWTGPIKCKNPQRGVWGGPTGDEVDDGTISAQNLAFTPRGKLALATVIQRDIWEIGYKKQAAPAKSKATVKTMGIGLGSLLLLVMGGVWIARRRKR
ncbi:MAG TPA: DUF2330 domain-containing protein [Kofleriaceae bacterium]|nr:DUF2330 domain-containing protein [Kofleriaceae bacterium]